MSAKVHLMRASDGGFYFILKAPNGEAILSSPMFLSKAAAEKGIALVKANAGADEHYERRGEHNDNPYFVLKADSLIIGTSQIYRSPAAMEAGILSSRTNAVSAEVVDRTTTVR
jgi:uncharacterized protein YegP (UPF0339 family)